VANTFYTPEQVAKVAVALAVEDSYLSALVNRNFEDDLLGGGGKGRSVNIKVPATLIARDRDIDDKTSSIIMDEITESTVSVTLGTHGYNAVSLSEGDLNLNLTSFAEQVLAPQVDAVVDRVEHEVATLLLGVAEWNNLAATADTPAAPAYDAANPVKVFTALRKRLRDNGVPQANLNCIVGTKVYADLLEANAIQDASASGSTAALRDGSVGRVRGFNVVESTRVDDEDIVAFHRDAVTLAVRAPAVPSGASFGQSLSKGGFSLRYLRDYDADKTADRSIVSTFFGAALLPVKKITRDYGTRAVTVADVPAVIRYNAGTALV
jgi:hypothetical protein